MEEGVGHLPYDLALPLHLRVQLRTRHYAPATSLINCPSSLLWLPPLESFLAAWLIGPILDYFVEIVGPIFFLSSYFEVQSSFLEVQKSFQNAHLQKLSKWERQGKFGGSIKSSGNWSSHTWRACNDTVDQMS